MLKPDTEAATTDQMLTLVKSELGIAFVPEPMAKELLERGGAGAAPSAGDHPGAQHLSGV